MVGGRLFVGAIVVASALGPRVSFAAPPGGTADADERTRIYQEGVDLAGKGEWSAAAQRFRRVVAMKASAKALFTLGEAEQNLGRLASAKSAFEKAAASAMESREADVARLARERAAAIAPRVPVIILKLPQGTEDPRATIDGVVAPVDGAPREVDPGRHTVTVEARGHKPFESQIDVAAATRAVVAVAFESAAPPQVTREPTEATVNSSARPPLAAIVLGGIGVAAGGVGLALYLSGKSSYDGACGAAHVCATAAERDSGNGGRTTMVAGDVAMIAGSAALGAAVVVWVAAATKSDAAPSAAQLAMGAIGSGAGFRLTLTR